MTECHHWNMPCIFGGRRILDRSSKRSPFAVGVNDLSFPYQPPEKHKKNPQHTHRHQTLHRSTTTRTCEFRLITYPARPNRELSSSTLSANGAPQMPELLVSRSRALGDSRTALRRLRQEGFQRPSVRNYLQLVRILETGGRRRVQGSLRGGVGLRRMSCGHGCGV